MKIVSMENREDRERGIELLEKLGYKRVESNLLIYFMEKGKGKSREIERAMDLREYEVSTGTKVLINKGILIGTIAHHKGRGRSEIFYTALTRDRILDKIKEKALLRVEEIEKTLNQLEQIVNDFRKEKRG